MVDKAQRRHPGRGRTVITGPDDYAPGNVIVPAPWPVDWIGRWLGLDRALEADLQRSGLHGRGAPGTA